jgi:hypothetical protein
MSLYRYDTTIGKESKTVVIYSKEGLDTKVVPSNLASSSDRAGVHFVHVIDRSYSMTHYIKELIDNVKKCVDEMGKNDLLSIIWFSSSDMCEVLIKGAKKGPELHDLLDSIASVKHLTCFSVPLKKVAECVQDLKAMCPNFMVTFFTDGQPVTDEWSTDQEYDRIRSALAEMPEEVIALNSVGYGYYNRELLQEISDSTPLGKTFHSHRISEYHEIFKHNQGRATGLTHRKVEFSCDDINARILYLSDRDSSLFLSNTATVSHWSPDKNFVVFVMNEGSTVTVDDKAYDIALLPDLRVSNFRDHLLYTMAYELYYNGHTRECLDILSENLKDKALIDKHLQAFTNKERQEYTDLLCEASLDSDNRLTGGVSPDDYVPDANAPCILDVFNILAESGDSFYLPGHTNYARTTRKAEDKDNKFVKSDQETKAPMSDFVWAKDRLNLSVRFAINGHVNLDTDEANRVNLPEKIDATIWRNHTFIKDGELHVSSAVFLISKKTLKAIQKITDKVMWSDSKSSYDVVEAIIPFDSIPVTNQGYIERSLDVNTVFDLTVSTLKLEALQKVANYFSTKIKENRAIAKKEENFKNLTLDQIEVLENHGLDKNLWYSPVTLEMKSSGDSDYYEVRHFQFQIKGCASLPSLNAVATKAKKISDGGKAKLNVVEEVMHQYETELRDRYDFDNPTFKVRDLMQEELKTIKTSLLESRNKLSCLKMSRILTGDWWPDLKQDEKGNYTWTKDGLTMVAKVTRKKQYV